MSSDVTIRDILREAILVKAGLSVTDAAERLGVGRPALSNMLSGNAGLSIPLAVSIERAFGLSARDLLIKQLDDELAAAGGAPAPKAVVKVPVAKPKAAVRAEVATERPAFKSRLKGEWKAP